MLMAPGTAARTFFHSPQRVFVLGIAVLFIGLSIQYSHKADDNRSAFVRWRPQVLEVADADIYQRYDYPNPPIMALVLLPLAYLPPLAGSLVWFYLKLGMTLLAFRWVFRLVETSGQPFPPWAKAVTVLLSLRPIMGDLSHGNINLFILFLVVASLFAFSRGRDWLSGMLMALAITCKVTPALFVPYFLWKRAWKAAGGCILGLVLFFGLVPGAALGFGWNAQLLASWTERMVKPFVVDGFITSEHHNQSLPGLLSRTLTESPSFSTYVDDQHTPLEYHNLLTLDPDLVRWLLKGCMGLFALLIIWCCRTPARPRVGWRLAAEYSLVLIGMLLFSERTWKHHCVTLLLPFAVLTYYLAVCRPGPMLRRYLLGSLVAVVLLISLTSTSLLSAVEGGAKLAQVFGAYVWANLVLVGALVVLLRRSGTMAAESGESAVAVPLGIRRDAASVPALGSHPPDARRRLPRSYC
jgi:alpha-1,2-mannosyltransferase